MLAQRPDYRGGPSLMQDPYVHQLENSTDGGGKITVQRYILRTEVLFLPFYHPLIDNLEGYKQRGATLRRDIAVHNAPSLEYDL